MHAPRSQSPRHSMLSRHFAPTFFCGAQVFTSHQKPTAQSSWREHFAPPQAQIRDLAREHFAPAAPSAFTHLWRPVEQNVPSAQEYGPQPSPSWSRRRQVSAEQYVSGEQTRDGARCRSVAAHGPFSADGVVHLPIFEFRPIAHAKPGVHSQSSRHIVPGAALPVNSASHACSHSVPAISLAEALHGLCLVDLGAAVLQAPLHPRHALLHRGREVVACRLERIVLPRAAVLQIRARREERATDHRRGDGLSRRQRPAGPLRCRRVEHGLDVRLRRGQRSGRRGLLLRARGQDETREQYVRCSHLFFSPSASAGTARLASRYHREKTAERPCVTSRLADPRGATTRELRDHDGVPAKWFGKTALVFLSGRKRNGRREQRCVITCPSWHDFPRSGHGAGIGHGARAVAWDLTSTGTAVWCAP